MVQERAFKIPLQLFLSLLVLQAASCTDLPLLAQLRPSSSVYSVHSFTPSSNIHRLRGGMAEVVHGKPAEGMECMVTFDDITEENYCEYLAQPSGTWLPAKFADTVVKEMIDTQFQKYLDDVEKAARDCAAAVRRLVVKGPPTYLFDAHGLTLPEGDTHISEVWFCNGNVTVSAKLKGALEGAERDNLWDGQRAVLASMEAAEVSDGAKEGGGRTVSPSQSVSEDKTAPESEEVLASLVPAGARRLEREVRLLDLRCKPKRTKELERRREEGNRRALGQARHWHTPVLCRDGSFLDSKFN